MKSISASIVILAAAVLVVGASFARDGGVGIWVAILGLVVGAAGLNQWFATLKEK